MKTLELSCYTKNKTNFYDGVSSALLSKLIFNDHDGNFVKSSTNPKCNKINLFYLDKMKNEK